MAIATIEGLEVQRFVQSAFRLRGREVTVYVDPHRVGDAPKADLILVSHEHFDHLDPDTITSLETEETVIVTTEGCARRLRGRPRLVVVHEGESATERGVPVRAVAGYNRFHPRGFNLGFLLTLDGVRIFHPGDSDRVPEWTALRNSVDVALLPIGGTYTMAEKEAAEVVRALHPKVAVPMHYGYATGGDPQRFAELVGDAAQVVIL